MDISILNIVIWIWKLTFQFWKFYLNSKNVFDLKINIFESKNYYFNSKKIIESKNQHFDLKYFDLKKFDIWILKF